MVGLGLALGLGSGDNVDASDPGIELGDGVCNFDKVPPGFRVRVTTIF